ncbi:hypothetical protein GO730_02665 [Spirosoma sp. HMF3257]|uniref:Uncharacterized protein n=1 Tax=Spirosoma telluris TaxID=2183553 RepID=A0A327NH15_9BACT|nr:hypothetical protein [Spirosoma telluris]RAI73589.1 hypothetical protein HMF3257_02600 [Spirosoma telluris]
MAAERGLIKSIHHENIDKRGLLLWGLYYLLACRHTEPDPFSDGKPRIKSISFSGIPQENISIDQNARLITVRTPAKLTGMPLVSMELTDSAVWVNNKIVVAAPS